MRLSLRLLGRYSANGNNRPERIDHMTGHALVVRNAFFVMELADIVCKTTTKCSRWICAGRAIKSRGWSGRMQACSLCGLRRVEFLTTISRRAERYTEERYTELRASASGGTYRVCGCAGRFHCQLAVDFAGLTPDNFLLVGPAVGQDRPCVSGSRSCRSRWLVSGVLVWSWVFMQRCDGFFGSMSAHCLWLGALLYSRVGHASVAKRVV